MARLCKDDITERSEPHFISTLTGKQSCPVRDAEDVPSKAYSESTPVRGGLPCTPSWSLLLPLVHVVRPLQRDWPSLRNSCVSSLETGPLYNHGVLAARNPHCALQSGSCPQFRAPGTYLSAPWPLHVGGSFVCSGPLGPGGLTSQATKFGL